MEIRKAYSIGFTKRSAKDFFGTLKQAGIKRLIDIRLHNTSQLSGFAKRDDLAFFLQEICGAEYIHEPMLAPSEALLSDYRKKKTSFVEFAARFRQLLVERKVEEALARSIFDVPAVLLCGELKPERCHRRLVLEYLGEKWGALAIFHL